MRGFARVDEMRVKVQLAKKKIDSIKILVLCASRVCEKSKSRATVIILKGERMTSCSVECTHRV